MVVEAAADFSDARLWRFETDCESFAVDSLEDVSVPAGIGTWGDRLVVADASPGAAGLLVVDDALGVCNRLDLDVTLEPEEALRAVLPLPSDGGVLVSVGQRDPSAVAPWVGGRLLWVSIQSDPCDADAETLQVDAPAVDSENPSTWSRAPDVLTLVEGR